MCSNKSLFCFLLPRMIVQQSISTSFIYSKTKNNRKPFSIKICSFNRKWKCVYPINAKILIHFNTSIVSIVYAECAHYCKSPFFLLLSSFLFIFPLNRIIIVIVVIIIIIWLVNTNEISCQSNKSNIHDTLTHIHKYMLIELQQQQQHQQY